MNGQNDNDNIHIITIEDDSESDDSSDQQQRPTTDDLTHLTLYMEMELKSRQQSQKKDGVEPAPPSRPQTPRPPAAPPTPPPPPRPAPRQPISSFDSDGDADDIIFPESRDHIFEAPLSPITQSPIQRHFAQVGQPFANTPLLPQSNDNTDREAVPSRPVFSSALPPYRQINSQQYNVNQTNRGAEYNTDNGNEIGNKNGKDNNGNENYGTGNAVRSYRSHIYVSDDSDSDDDVFLESELSTQRFTSATPRQSHEQSPKNTRPLTAPGLLLSMPSQQQPFRSLNLEEFVGEMAGPSSTIASFVPMSQPKRPISTLKELVSRRIAAKMEEVGTGNRISVRKNLLRRSSSPQPSTSQNAMQDAQNNDYISVENNSGYIESFSPQPSTSRNCLQNIQNNSYAHVENNPDYTEQRPFSPRPSTSRHFSQNEPSTSFAQFGINLIQDDHNNGYTHVNMGNLPDHTERRSYPPPKPSTSSSKLKEFIGRRVAARQENITQSNGNDNLNREYNIVNQPFTSQPSTSFTNFNQIDQSNDYVNIFVEKNPNHMQRPPFISQPSTSTGYLGQTSRNIDDHNNSYANAFVEMNPPYIQQMPPFRPFGSSNLDEFICDRSNATNNYMERTPFSPFLPIGSSSLEESVGQRSNDIGNWDRSAYMERPPSFLQQQPNNSFDSSLNNSYAHVYRDNWVPPSTSTPFAPMSVPPPYRPTLNLNNFVGFSGQPGVQYGNNDYIGPYEMPSSSNDIGEEVDNYESDEEQEQEEQIEGEVEEVEPAEEVENDEYENDHDEEEPDVEEASENNIPHSTNINLTLICNNTIIVKVNNNDNKDNNEEDKQSSAALRNLLYGMDDSPIIAKRPRLDTSDALSFLNSLGAIISTRTNFSLASPTPYPTYTPSSSASQMSPVPSTSRMITQPQPLPRIPVTKHTCNLVGCRKSFDTFDELKTHVLVHASTKKIKCPVCETTYMPCDELASHITTHQDFNLLRESRAPELQALAAHERQFSQVAIVPSSVGGPPIFQPVSSSSFNISSSDSSSSNSSSSHSEINVVTIDNDNNTETYF